MSEPDQQHLKTIRLSSIAGVLAAAVVGSVVVVRNNTSPDAVLDVFAILGAACSICLFAISGMVGGSIGGLNSQGCFETGCLVLFGWLLFSLQIPVLAWLVHAGDGFGAVLSYSFVGLFVGLMAGSIASAIIGSRSA